MKSYKPVLTAGLLALATALPLNAALAATPPTAAQACAAASLKYTRLNVINVVIKGERQACKGKLNAAKLAARDSKLADKANKVHVALDCNANQDPDSLTTWPIEPATQVDIEAMWPADPCDGV